MAAAGVGGELADAFNAVAVVGGAFAAPSGAAPKPVRVLEPPNEATAAAPDAGGIMDAAAFGCVVSTPIAAVAAAGGEVVAPPGAAPGPVRVPEPAGDATGDSPVAGGVDDVVEVDDVESAAVCEDIGVRRA